MTSGILTLAAVVFGIVLLVLWVLLPFAMFGIKPLLSTLIEEQRKTNELLAKVAATSSTSPEVLPSP